MSAARRSSSPPRKWKSLGQRGGTQAGAATASCPATAALPRCIAALFLSLLKVSFVLAGGLQIFSPAD